jgi:hypothetical protein
VQLTPTTGRTPNSSGRIVVAMVATVIGLTVAVELEGSWWWDWAASPPHGAAGAVWTVVALAGARWATVPLTGVAVAARCWHQHRLSPAVAGAALLLVVTVTVVTLKWLVGRAAPGALARHSMGMSFPSGHVVNAVVTWGIIGWAWRDSPRMTITAGSAAGAVVATAVVALGWHWTGDAAAGEALGVLLLTLWLTAVERLGPRQDSPSLPPAQPTSSTCDHGRSQVWQPSTSRTRWTTEHRAVPAAVAALGVSPCALRADGL